MPKNITEHFSLDEFVLSRTAVIKGIDNTPTPEILKNIKTLARVLEEVRTLFGASVVITSGYRCPALNKAIGGASKSAHLQGLAADFTVPAAGTPLQVARKIAKSSIPFDQLIHEYGSWVHFGISIGPPRRQLLTIRSKSEGYLPGLLGIS